MNTKPNNTFIMNNPGQVYLYSNIRPSIVKTSRYELYIQGNPVLYSSLSGKEEWVNNTVEGIDGNFHRLEAYFKERLQITSGLFSLILVSDEKIILASDAIRSFPLLYCNHKGAWVITDNIECYQKENTRLVIAEDKLEEFFAYGNVFGNKTLYKDVYGLQAGEIVTLSDKKISTDRYFIFKPAIKSHVYDNEIDFANDFNDMFLFVFSRMLKNNPTVKNWVIPLSGGHDSRQVVNFLYRLGARNVICFTYGIPDNEQARISKQVAGAVGYEWHFVEYTAQKWHSLFTDGLMGDFIDYTFNGISLPHLQDFLAVYELKAMGIIGEGDIVLPGHTVVTETVFSEQTLRLKSKEKAIEYVYSKIVQMKPTHQGNASILKSLSTIYDGYQMEPKNFLSYYDWQERQSKFIANSVQGYTYLGFESRQPMWDREMVDFWLRIPAKGRLEREPLYQAEKHGGLVKELLAIPFACTGKKGLKEKAADHIRNILPQSVIDVLLRVTGRKAKLQEGLNHIYALRGNSVKEVIDPVEDFPPQTQDYFSQYLERYPYQMDPNIMSTLYTIRRFLDKSKLSDN